jgi:hypothetical protein
MAADSDGFNDMDNDAVCHMAAEVAADLDVNDNVDNHMV